MNTQKIAWHFDNIVYVGFQCSYIQVFSISQLFLVVFLMKQPFNGQIFINFIYISSAMVSKDTIIELQMKISREKFIISWDKM